MRSGEDCFGIEVYIMKKRKAWETAFQALVVSLWTQNQPHFAKSVHLAAQFRSGLCIHLKWMVPLQRPDRASCFFKQCCSNQNKHKGMTWHRCIVHDLQFIYLCFKWQESLFTWEGVFQYWCASLWFENGTDCPGISRFWRHFSLAWLMGYAPAGWTQQATPFKVFQ